MTSTISDNSPALLLRPHHLLCIQNYRGRGYSAGFHEKMSAVISKLKSSDGAAVKLIDGADDLCMACPHLQDGSCESESPDCFDRLVCARTGAAPGDTFIWKLPLNRFDDSPDGFQVPAMSRELLEECCPGCSWLELCMKIVSGSCEQQPVYT